MEQAFYHYKEWEDFQNGMYDEVKEGRQERVSKAVTLLTDLTELYKQMRRVTKEWKIATEQNLTNSSINHQAFLGQTACNIWGGVKEDETREAWGRLNNIQRYEANRVADRVYEEWKWQYEREHEVHHQVTLAEWWGDNA